MIFTKKKWVGKDFTIKCIGNDVYYKNAWEMTFTIKMHKKWFFCKNAWEMIFTIKMC